MSAVVSRQEKTILFDCSKRELFTPSQGLKSLKRKLGTNYKVTVNKDTITLNVLREASVAVFVGPRERSGPRYLCRDLGNTSTTSTIMLILCKCNLLLLYKVVPC